MIHRVHYHIRPQTQIFLFGRSHEHVITRRGFSSSLVLSCLVLAHMTMLIHLDWVTTLDLGKCLLNASVFLRQLRSTDISFAKENSR